MVSLIINGRKHAIDVEPQMPLLWALRDELVRRMLTRARPNSAKTIQARPSKSKQNCLDLLGFFRPNPDFSTGYGNSK